MAPAGPRLDELLPATLSLLRILLVYVAHALGADVQGQADRILRVLHVAAALHNVFRQEVKGYRTVNLLEEATEEAEVVIFPLDLAGDLIDEF